LHGDIKLENKVLKSFLAYTYFMYTVQKKPKKILKERQNDPD
jgi:hypothetical protein